MLPGTVIADRYRVVRLLGEGGMGAVYEGEHIAVGRRVAIKVLHANIAKRPGVIERFEREARAAAAIGHENIIDVFDFGMHEGSPFMVMEYLKGESLAAQIEREKKLSIERACYVMGQVLSALAAAHGAGIVHRDLKPDNVFLITKNGRADFVKVIDWGISKIGSGEGRSLTKTGMLMGTPYYMAPEQALARRDLDGRVDIYSAGVMLYEMLTGELPFTAESEVEIIMMICNRPSEPKSPRAINPAIPEELDAIVRRAMAFDRDARYVDAREMAAALVPFGAVPPGSVEAQSGQYRALNVPTAMGTPTAWISSNPNPVEGAEPVPVVPPAAQRRRSGIVVASAALVLALAVGGAAMAARARRSAPAAALPSRHAAGISTNASVRVEIAGLPPGARLWLDGLAAEERTFELARGSEHRLRVEAPQYMPYDSSFVAERSGSMYIALAPEPIAAPDAAVPAAPVAASSTRASPSDAAVHPMRRAGHQAPVTRSNVQGPRPAGSLLPAQTEY